MESILHQVFHYEVPCKKQTGCKLALCNLGSNIPTAGSSLDSNSVISSKSPISGEASEQNSSTVISPSPNVSQSKIPVTTLPVPRLWRLAQWLWLAGFTFFVFRMAKLEYLFRMRLKPAPNGMTAIPNSKLLITPPQYKHRLAPLKIASRLRALLQKIARLCISIMPKV
ncbi:hypothetical protein [Microaerobacter geothermalis]|uniref:hypothetical protein n=1 Tax=Microaerobacter geothermalis TaxID=674972 RepID=UPI001F26C8FF|nr:hypothetical protein [Microaerobacter geothermalis]